MIVSHRHKFIFIKTRKTAGTSLEIALSEICGPDDIITPIVAKDEAYRRELGYRGPQNYRIPLRQFRLAELIEFRKNRKTLRFYHHMAADQVRRHIGEQVWNDYFKFTVERNPYDKLISWYYWRGGKNKHGSLNQFIATETAGKMSGFEQYVSHGQLLVDKVYKFEALNEALADISRRIGLDRTLQMPARKTKGGTKKDKRHYSEVLSDEARDWVSKVFAREIAFFDYTFEHHMREEEMQPRLEQ
jgi:hypothetical protein